MLSRDGAMAARPSRKLAGSTIALLTLSLLAARAADDAVQPSQIAAPSAGRSLPDAETTGAIPPNGLTGLTSQDQRIDPTTLRAAVDAYRKGRLDEGDALTRSIDDAAARTMLEWLAIRSQAGAIGLQRIERFLAQNPNYPGTLPFLRMAEATLVRDRHSAQTIRSFFHGREPVSAPGRIALAQVLAGDGRTAEAQALIRRVWREDALGEGLEKRILTQFGADLGVADHRLRTERFIFRGDGRGALRNAARVSADHVALVRLRLASAKARGPIAQKQIDALPASVRSEPSYAFLLAQQARRSGKSVEAVAAMASAPETAAELGDGDGWWAERRLLARRLLDEGQARAAYDIAAGHAAEGSAERIEAEWHAGWIALRFLNDATRASRHFAEAAAIAETPISVARALYWQGRASEALGREAEARDLYARAGEHPVAYYGQLARARLGLADLPVRRTMAAELAHLPGFKAVRLLYAIEEEGLARTMLLDLSQRLHDAASLEAIAGIARAQRDVRTLLAIGKTALQRGFPLDEAAFPTFGVPDFPIVGDPMERAIVHAIARQESAFDPAAVSHAGARGLMQMMPATARETARRASMPFELERLTRDPLYSAQMGAAHLNDLIVEWRGSYVLTFAAYNAGSGNVRRWIAAYGDPRSPEVDAVDWVERIPFTETRNYVQRVMENLQVYRQRLNQRTAYLIDADLKRGWRRD
jgi:soluble lytic murein transglycosylase